MMFRIAILVSAIAVAPACVEELASEEESLLIAASRSVYTPDNMVRVANVNLYKGSFNEEKTDSRNFLYYLANSTYVPDIFTVQNLANNGNGYHGCADIARKLEEYLQPKSVNYEIYYPAERGGSCVIYRGGRFERIATVKGLGSWSGAPACDQQGMTSVGVRLRDRNFQNKTISVLSVHMPGQCTTKNTTELRAWANAAGSDLRIIAGDFNTNTGPGWGSIPNMKEVLEASGYRTADVWGNLDWIWRKGQSRVDNIKRVEYAEARGVGYPSATNYSDHRGGFEDLTY